MEASHGAACKPACQRSPVRDSVHWKDGTATSPCLQLLQRYPQRLFKALNKVQQPQSSHGLAARQPVPQTWKKTSCHHHWRSSQGVRGGKYSCPRKCTASATVRCSPPHSFCKAMSDTVLFSPNFGHVVEKSRSTSSCKMLFMTVKSVGRKWRNQEEEIKAMSTGLFLQTV